MNTEIIHTTTDQLDTQALHRTDFPCPAVLGIASGIFFMAFFGAYWGFTSAVFMRSFFQFIAFLVIGLVTLVLFAIGGILLKYALSLLKCYPRRMKPSRRESGRGLVLSLELSLC